MHALRLGGRTHDTCGELAGAPTERAWHRERDTHIQRETRSTMEGTLETLGTNETDA